MIIRTSDLKTFHPYKSQYDEYLMIFKIDRTKKYPEALIIRWSEDRELDKRIVAFYEENGDSKYLIHESSRIDKEFFEGIKTRNWEGVPGISLIFKELFGGR